MITQNDILLLLLNALVVPQMFFQLLGRLAAASGDPTGPAVIKASSGAVSGFRLDSKWEQNTKVSVPNAHLCSMAVEMENTFEGGCPLLT